MEIKDMIRVFEDDIKSLIQGIEDKIPRILRDIKENKERKGKFTIDFDSFIYLINEFCFHTDCINFHPIKGYLPENRMKLFENIILSQIKIEPIHRQPFPRGRELVYSKEKLYYRFFYSIFTQYITTNEPVSKIFQNKLNLWKDALNSNKFPIIFQINLSDFNFEGDKLDISAEISLKKVPFYSHILLNLTETYGLHKLLIFKTKLKFELELIEDSELNNQFDFIIDKEDWEEKLKSIEEIIFCLRIIGYSFVYNGDYDISYPWWFRERRKLFRHPFKSFGTLEIGRERITNFTELFNLIKNTNFIKDQECKIWIKRYSQLFEREEWQDTILDQFIILESIFTYRSRSEITFRLSLNIGLFLEEKIEDFRNTFDCIKDLYKLRGSVVHGEDWEKDLRSKEIIRNLTVKDRNQKKYDIIFEVFSILKTYIDRTFKKMLQIKNRLIQKNENTKIFQHIKSYYFLENSSFVQQAIKYDQIKNKE